ncbi:GNAT family N-acetyltransferase [Sphingobacterium sp. InxBP1]|uniref:GNAT family N-acetyltransferase n=1 Tax=Sphingobacterium sp. InxBP1 TaxID=2870328 RepID=UPI002244C36B|nr:GNAT family N-acetyltransferase [Sphingobacterium sp. InxBP1]MCW8311394.1 GNAT family N-acetyltransferase [Sphingobacterium sp. InxBP1]
MENTDLSNIVIEEWSEPDGKTISELASLTMDVVRGGASVGFMGDLSHEEASNFWQQVLVKATAGKIVLLIAKNTSSNQIVGTVQLQVDLPRNQPHRADVAKMLVHSSFRRRGLAESLLNRIEQLAKTLGKSLLVLDTVSYSPAHALYLKCGWKVVGEIPNYALLPDGTPCGTTYFYKSLIAD